jgi:hypothetical protein
MMIIEQFREYIRKERARGVAPEEIRDALLKQGEHRTARQFDSSWGAVEVDEAFRLEGVSVKKN